MLVPGIDPENIKGKSFDTMAIDIHEVENGKIKKTWHIEDWLTALEQFLGKPFIIWIDPFCLKKQVTFSRQQ